MAGLSAAHHLIEKGLSVLILEAKDRLGGRLDTVDFAGFPLDTGAGWIHGSGPGDELEALEGMMNPMFTLC